MEPNPSWDKTNTHAGGSPGISFFQSSSVGCFFLTPVIHVVSKILHNAEMLKKKKKKRKREREKIGSVCYSPSFLRKPLLLFWHIYFHMYRWKFYPLAGLIFEASINSVVLGREIVVCVILVMWELCFIFFYFSLKYS